MSLLQQPIDINAQLISRALQFVDIAADFLQRGFEVADHDLACGLDLAIEQGNDFHTCHAATPQKRQGGACRPQPVAICAETLRQVKP